MTRSVPTPRLGVCYYPEHWPREWWRNDAQRMREMGQAARREYEQRYTPETNHEQLVGIYRSVMSGGTTTEARRAAA